MAGPKGPHKSIFPIKSPQTTLLGAHKHFHSTYLVLFFQKLTTSCTLSRPGFRERLVVSNCETLTNRFFRFFASCFRLSWPYSISDAYEIDPPSGLYSFSNAFLAHIRDIRMWAMGKDFFQYFPELQDDMAAEAPTSAVPLQRGVPAAM